MVVLPFMATFYFSFYPAHGETMNRILSYRTAQLTEFEGYYQLDKDKDQYLQILVRNDKLVLKQLWDQREITFEQKSALNFYNDELSFPLTFSKNANGEITQVLAFEHDTWIKVKNYQPVVKKEISLSPEKMNAFAGKYKITNDGHEKSAIYGSREFTGSQRTLDWENMYTIVPESELVFFAKNGHYPVQFSKDKDGNVTQALIFNVDVWLKVKD